MVRGRVVIEEVLPAASGEGLPEAHYTKYYRLQNLSGNDSDLHSMDNQYFQRLKLKDV